MTEIKTKFVGFDSYPTARIAAEKFIENNPEYDSADLTVFPGFCDVHVHLREPGFSYKETIKTGTMAAARGGYTVVCSMSNVNPVPDSIENLKIQLDLIEKDASIRVVPYGSITKSQLGETLSDMEALAQSVVAFSDDGKGIQSLSISKDAMIKAKSLGKAIVAHCEDNSLLKGGYICDGEYAKKHNHRGICAESEWGPIKRDLELAKETGCSYHVCHVSRKESVALIREAKALGVDATCETAPHYLLLDEGDLREDGRFKMNPPLGRREDRLALIEGLKDGTVDMIATDHAPHSVEEKSRGLEKSPFGVVGLETAFSVLYSGLVKKGIITLEKLIEVLAVNPRKRFNLPIGEEFSIWRLDEEYTINSNDFLSLGKASPFDGEKAFGRNILTAFNGKIVYKQ